MTNFIVVKHFKKSGNCYYQVNESPLKIDFHFPLHWNADHHIHKSGPDHCDNCYEYGMYNGVFIGYCVNCAEYVYHLKRGLGMKGKGIERTPEDICEEFISQHSLFIPMYLIERFTEFHCSTFAKESMWNTYMREVESI